MFSIPTALLLFTVLHRISSAEVILFSLTLHCLINTLVNTVCRHCRHTSLTVTRNWTVTRNSTQSWVWLWKSSKMDSPFQDCGKLSSEVGNVSRKVNLIQYSTPSTYIIYNTLLPVHISYIILYSQYIYHIQHYSQYIYHI